jgi:hypothetical protein
MSLAAAYARLTEVFPALRVTEEAPRGGDGWTAAYELAAGGPALDSFLARDEEQLLRDYGDPARPDVVAGFGLHRYAWPVCLLFTVPGSCTAGCLGSPSPMCRSTAPPAG